MMKPYQVYLKKENGRQYEQMLEQQFYGQIDGRLRAVYLELNDWVLREFVGKIIIITCLNRTPQENKTVGGKPYSAHLDCRAFDGRIRKDFSLDEIKQIERHLLEVWGDFLYVKVHGKGYNKHIHVNIRHKYIRKTFGLLTGS